MIWSKLVGNISYWRWNDLEFERLVLVHESASLGPLLLAPGPRPMFEPDWPRPSTSTNAVQDAWSKNPLNFNPLGDLGVTWKPVSDSWGPSPGNPVVNNSGPVCASCSEGQLVTSRCRDCSEDLCDNCVRAHQRVKLTREHTIVRYPDNKQTLFGQVRLKSGFSWIRKVYP